MPVPLSRAGALASLAAVLGVAALPTPAAGQGIHHLTPFVAAGDVGPGGFLLGAAFSTGYGPLALRASGGAGTSPTLTADGTGETRPWAADMDLVLLFGTARAAVAPYALGGLGARGSFGQAGGDPELHVGYGGGLRVRLSDNIALELESREYWPLDALTDSRTARSGRELRAGLAMRVGGARTASAPTPAASRRPPEPATRTFPPRAASAVAARTIETGEAYLGTPYLWGGSRPDTGFDCSGFVQYVYRRNGIELPRVSRDQARAGARLPADLSLVEPGDLLFFATDGVRIDHVAIYTGSGRILHSSRSGGGVRYDDLGSRRGDWYVRHFVAARRVIDAGWFRFGAASR